MPVQSIRHPVIAAKRRQVLPRWVRVRDARLTARVNAWRAPAWLDRGSARLSRLADHGVLWFTIAGVLALLGRRRAALRGTASLAVASALANLIGKRLFGGDRPLLKDVPVGRRLARTPTSASFPSGHSASAAAFTVGVGLEDPLAGLALAPLAAGVAYSRIHTGAHWASDVLGGLAIGAVVATAGRVLVGKPPRRVPAASAPAVRLTAVSPTGGGLSILVNPGSGNGGAPDVLAQRLPDAAVHHLGDGEDLVVLLDRVIETDHPSAIGVWGGDGTASAVADRARTRGLPLVVFPGGTLNHFAGALGIGSAEDVVRAIQQGTGREVDVAIASFAGGQEQTVLNTASLGLYPPFVSVRDRFQPRFGRPVAALIAAVRVVAAAAPLRVTIGAFDLPTWSVFLGVNRYGSGGAAPTRRSRLDDGVLDVRILNAGSTARTRGVFGLVFAGGANRVSRLLPFTKHRTIIERFEQRVVDVVVTAPYRNAAVFAYDGETVGLPDAAAFDDRRARLSMRMAPGALTVYAPVP